jgi:hypothetical protein
MSTLERLVRTLLEDEHGISEESFNCLAELTSELGENLRILFTQADAVDGRFFHPGE